MISAHTLQFLYFFSYCQDLIASDRNVVITPNGVTHIISTHAFKI